MSATGDVAVEEIPTVTGSVPVDRLGYVMTHEHVFILSVGLYDQWPHLLDRETVVERAIKALRTAKENGVDTMVDMTTPNIGRDIELIAEVAAATDVNIVLATGAHPLLPLPMYLQKALGRKTQLGLTLEEVADLFVRDIEIGIGGTDVRAGVIKVGTDPVLDEITERTLQMAAIAHLKTGVPISTHSNAPMKGGIAELDVFEREGVDLGRVVIGHSGDSDDLDYLSAMIERGAYVGLDRFGFRNPDFPVLGTPERVGVVKELCDRGYVERLLLSHDAVCWKAIPADIDYLTSWDLSYIRKEVTPLLLEAGVSEADLETMTVANPARLLRRATKA